MKAKGYLSVSAALLWLCSGFNADGGPGLAGAIEPSQKIAGAAPPPTTPPSEHAGNAPELLNAGHSTDKVFRVAQHSGDGGKPPARALPEGHPKIEGSSGNASGGQPLDFSRISKPSGGKNIAEIYKEKPRLVGKKIAVRGKVVKFNTGIMGKNWLHLRDGTGAEGTNDLTVTTDGVAKVGDTVLVRGALTADKDFGHGYKYPVIIEDAQVTVE